MTRNKANSHRQQYHHQQQASTSSGQHFFDYYAQLGVDRKATAEQIKLAYRRLALRHHPDKEGSNEAFIKVRTAYDVLGDPEKRRAYDQQCSFDELKAQRKPPPPRKSHNASEFDFYRMADEEEHDAENMWQRHHSQKQQGDAELAFAESMFRYICAFVGIFACVAFAKSDLPSQLPGVCVNVAGLCIFIAFIVFWRKILTSRS